MNVSIKGSRVFDCAATAGACEIARNSLAASAVIDDGFSYLDYAFHRRIEFYLALLYFLRRWIGRLVALDSTPLVEARVIVRDNGSITYVVE